MPKTANTGETPRMALDERSGRLGKNLLARTPAQIQWSVKSRMCYSATLTPEPPISFGTSFIFSNPSLIRSFVS